MSHNSLLKEVKAKENPLKAKILASFFKTDKGQYGEGDLFLGITVPESRKLAVKYSELEFGDISILIKNKYHEVRLIALLILVHKYQILNKQRLIGDEASVIKAFAAQKKIVNFYLKNTKYINNWDLVDLSAHYIVGDYLFNLSQQKPLQNYPKVTLLKLSKSKSLWERRIAIVSTFAFIYKGESRWTFNITTILMSDPHDLIHKACGWMLREVGKRVKESELTSFLDQYGLQMPRTMLRYAIERLPEHKRLYYLKRE